MVCHFLLQGIFLTQDSNPCLLCPLHGRQILYHWATKSCHSVKCGIIWHSVSLHIEEKAWSPNYKQTLFCALSTRSNYRFWRDRDCGLKLSQAGLSFCGSVLIMSLMALNSQETEKAIHWYSSWGVLADCICFVKWYKEMGKRLKFLKEMLISLWNWQVSNLRMNPDG